MANSGDCAAQLKLRPSENEAQGFKFLVSSFKPKILQA